MVRKGEARLLSTYLVHLAVRELAQQTRDSDGNTLLHQSASLGDFETTRVLLTYGGADPDAANYRGEVPLHAAAANGHLFVCSLLLKGRGGSSDKAATAAATTTMRPVTGVDPRNEDGQTPLMYACFRGHRDVVRFLLYVGAESSSASELGLTCAHAAAQEGHLEVLETLLEAEEKKAGNERGGADPRRTMSWSTTKEGHTPLHLAASSGNVDCLKRLIAAGADVNAKDAKGVTPLILSAFVDQLSSVRALLSAGADATVADEDGFTALHAATQEGHLEVVEEILGQEDRVVGRILEATNGDGSTPLVMAVRENDMEMVKLLIAKVNLKLLLP